MSKIPEDPERFVRTYLPERLGRAQGTLGTLSSVGSVTFRVEGAGEWSLRLRDGALEVVAGMEDDVVLQVTVGAEDFVPLVVDAARREEQTAGPPLRAGAVRALFADVETARLVRHVPGSVLLVIREEAARRRILVTPGRRRADLGDADCTIEIDREDFLDVQTGRQQAMQLFLGGKLTIQGNVQIALALSGVLG